MTVELCCNPATEGGAVISFFFGYLSLALTWCQSAPVLGTAVAFLTSVFDHLHNGLESVFSFVVSYIPDLLTGHVRQHLHNTLMFVLPLRAFFVALVFMWAYRRHEGKFRKALMYAVAAFCASVLVTAFCSHAIFANMFEGPISRLSLNMVFAGSLDTEVGGALGGTVLRLAFLTHPIVHLLIGVISGFIAYPLARFCVHMVNHLGCRDLNETDVSLVERFLEFLDSFNTMSIVHRIMYAMAFLYFLRPSMAIVAMVHLIWCQLASSGSSGSRDLGATLESVIRASHSILVALVVQRLACAFGGYFLYACLLSCVCMIFVVRVDEVPLLKHVFHQIMYRISFGMLFTDHVRAMSDSDLPVFFRHHLFFRWARRTAYLASVCLIVSIVTMCWVLIYRHRTDDTFYNSTEVSALSDIVSGKNQTDSLVFLWSRIFQWPLIVATDIQTFILETVAAI
jgi:hypothetical protein